MYDPVTLDQLRAFVAVATEGSFSAAARKLKRVQSAISTSMANLEAQLGVPLWDRTTKVARLTHQGKAVLAAARRVLAEVDALRQLTTGMASGLEPAVSLCFDALFPSEALLDLCEAFAKEFPAVELRVDTQVLSAVGARVLSGKATLGVVAPPGVVAGLEREPLASIRMVPVVSRAHPLARFAAKIPTRELQDETQIVLSEGVDSGVPDQGVLSPRTWRVADLRTKHMMLLRGLGWGNLPDHMIRDDLRSGDLVRIQPVSWAEDENVVHLSAVYRGDTVIGPAHRWVLKELRVLCARDAGEPLLPSPKPRVRRSG